MMTTTAMQNTSHERCNNTDTDSAAFKTWFGTSAVCDHAGEPLEMYHGTAVPVGGRRTSFDLCPPSRSTSTASQALGFFFTRHKHEAQTYAAAAVSEGIGEEVHVVQAYLSVQNPLQISITDFYEATEYKLEDEIHAMRADLIDQGYDGIFVGENGDVVVFHPGQIKSTQTNTGNYSSTCPDITDGYYFATRRLQPAP